MRGGHSTRAYAGRRAAVGVVVCTVLGAAASASAGATGRLAGLTQITYGCPGPQRVGQPCERWSVFKHARFAVTRVRPDGTPIASTRRVVVSDGNGRFSLVLTTGTYTVTPLPQAHTHGGRSLTTRVRIGQVTRTTIRFLGYPMML
jgi:hypothetical protein